MKKITGGPSGLKETYPPKPGNGPKPVQRPGDNKDNWRKGEWNKKPGYGLPPRGGGNFDVVIDDGARIGRPVPPRRGGVRPMPPMKIKPLRKV